VPFCLEKTLREAILPKAHRDDAAEFRAKTMQMPEVQAALAEGRPRLQAWYATIPLDDNQKVGINQWVSTLQALNVIGTFTCTQGSDIVGDDRVGTGMLQLALGVARVEQANGGQHTQQAAARIHGGHQRGRQREKELPPVFAPAWRRRALRAVTPQQWQSRSAHPVPSTRSSVLSAELVAAAPQAPNPCSAFKSCSSSVAAALSPLALNTTSPPATVSTSRTVPKRVPLSACTMEKPSSTPAPPCSARNSSSEGGERR
jgi:hypothetical protein